MLWKKKNSVSNYSPSCCSKLIRPLFIFGTQIKIFLRNPRALWPSIDSNGTNMIKIQKGSKDINKIVHISGSTVMLSSYEILFVRKDNKNNNFIQQFLLFWVSQLPFTRVSQLFISTDKAHILYDHILHPWSYPIPKFNNHFTNY